jgi:hypothetical protein
MKNQNLDRIGNNRELYERVLSTMKDPSNYMSDGPDGWTVSSCVRDGGRVGIVALNILNGTLMDGMKHGKGEGPQIGLIRLKVLSRQACQADKNGKILNHSRKLFAHEEDEDKAQGMPSIDTPPEVGDFILVKGDPRMYNHLGHRMIATVAAEFEMRSMHDKYRWRNGLRYLYAEYQVDSDGCIDVTPDDAVTLLSRFGEDLVFPAFRKDGMQVDRGMRARRVITNWLFREVPKNYTEKKQASEPDETEDKPAKRGRRVKYADPTETEVEG